jgi:hypothetical protein
VKVWVLGKSPGFESDVVMCRLVNVPKRLRAITTLQRSAAQ